LRAFPVAYFSAEFGLHESLPIYSGGLGVLAGDHLKAASDLGIPMVAVGLAYTYGYFEQSLDASGWQHEHYFPSMRALPWSCQKRRPVRIAVRRSLMRFQHLAGSRRPQSSAAGHERGRQPDEDKA
jgi:glucan phosphorylase